MKVQVEKSQAEQVAQAVERLERAARRYVLTRTTKATQPAAVKCWQTKAMKAAHEFAEALAQVQAVLSDEAWRRCVEVARGVARPVTWEALAYGVSVAAAIQRDYDETGAQR